MGTKGHACQKRIYMHIFQTSDRSNLDQYYPPPDLPELLYSDSLYMYLYHFTFYSGFNQSEKVPKI